MYCFNFLSCLPVIMDSASVSMSQIKIFCKLLLVIVLYHNKRKVMSIMMYFTCMCLLEEVYTPQYQRGDQWTATGIGFHLPTCFS